MSHTLSPRRARILASALALAAAAALFFANLGNHYLWQDEAQTALIARSISLRGVPLGHDGLNSFSQEGGAEFGDNRVWRWHGWLPFYLVAGSFALFGESAFAARLPSALLGLASVLLIWFAALRLWRDRRAAAASAALLALSVPFLLLSRQCRWYAATAFFSLLALHAYAKIDSAGRAPAAWLFAAATLLLHSQLIYCATLLPALILHAAIFERRKLRATGAVSAAVMLVNLPWIAWLAGMGYAERYGAQLIDPARWARFAWAYLRHVFGSLLPIWPLLAAPLLLALHARRRERLVQISAETRSGLALLMLFCAATLVAVTLTSPGVFLRYLAPLAAPLALVGGVLVGALWRRAPLLAAALVSVWLATGQLRDFLYEIRHDFRGPVEAIVEFLRERADPDDVVATNYGDLPIKFYTGLRVVGGLTGEDLSEVRGADWIIVRKWALTDEDARVRAALLEEIVRAPHRRFVLDVPDTPFENREEPSAHRFRSARDGRPVVIWGGKQ